ncbi:UDP-glucose 4-epimerase GalE [Paenibacillus sp. 2TAB23]|uniref:UDP-glucose 4-epimerase GalE n=1 Tax=Paenibacillus sp. 2TAB23 TaxID=3233004 RepID=UPI003F9824FD
MAILICGGAGYIGSHVVAALIEQHEEIVVIDRMAVGREYSVLGGKLYNGDLNDRVMLDKIFKENEIEAVIHLSASSLVGESMTKPLEYYRNNVEGTLRLLETMHKHCVNKIVFSSTAAVYGDPERIPIREDDRKIPRNTYGETKLAIERMLHWVEQAHGIKYVILRYFNVAGAHDNGLIGEDHDPETHLIPLAIQAALGQRENIMIYGDDYSTKDGSCIRDYVHVMDVAEAHLLAMNSLRNGGRSGIYNLGNSEGFTVKEVIETVKKVTGLDFPVQIASRRQGDPAVLIASPDLIKEELDWSPKRSSLEKMVASAWEWHRTHPHGYAKGNEETWRRESQS